MKKISCTLFLLFSFICSHAQIPAWAFNIGSSSTAITPSGTEFGYSCKVGPNGNVCMTGKFIGTMDLDPGPGVSNVTSNGQTDIFLACYTSAGAFLWGFSIGGANYDGGYDVDIDPSNNVIVVGTFQSAGVDFDPGGGVTTLPFAGGTGLPYEGDGFVAKYSSTGVFQWAKGLGGPTVYDFANAVTTDALGCVYVGGSFNTTMTISGSITFSSAAAGTGYLIKYSPAGTVMWGHNFGTFGVSDIDCAVLSLKQSNGFVYACGVFRGSADFYPPPWGGSFLLATASSSNFDGFVSKYDTAGNFVYAKQIQGSGPNDYTNDIALDAADNIYVTGYSNSPVLIFDVTSPGTTAVTVPGGGIAKDLYFAKYDNAGTFQWGKAMGSPTTDDAGRSVDVAGSSLYVTGEFRNTADFDPSAAVANLVSHGSADMYLVKYDLDGNYLCGFNVGAATVDDIGYGLTHDPTGYVYTSGQFGGTGTDFDPSIGTLSLTSNGGADIYLGKYDVCASLINPTCDSIDLADTVSVCIDDTVTLRATVYGSNPISSILWSPSSGLSSTTVLTPLLTSSSSGYYNLTIRSILPLNLVANGDFSAGNTGFTSSYTYSPPPSPVLLEGDYSVYTNPFGVHTGFTSMGDHTTGTGNMMIMNGGPAAVDVWCQTISVTPNTDYDFSAWFANCSSVTIGPDVPILQFRINGILQGTPTTITAAPGTWVSFATTWNSGPSTSATICIYDAVTTASGNDFVIDDITFREICTIRDSVYVNVTLPDTTYTTHDTDLCNSSFPYTLTAPSGYTTYIWSTGSTSPTTIAVAGSGTYWVTAFKGCAYVSDTFHVGLYVSPVVALGIDTGFCVGNTLVISSPQPPGSAWTWSTGSTGDSIHVSTSGSYSLTVTSSDGCTASDVINILVSPVPNVSLGPDTVECHGRALLLMSSVMYTTPVYLWHDNSTGPTFTATTTGTYWLQVTEGGCPGADTIHVEIKFDTFTLYNPDTAICKGKSVQVYATGDPNIHFQWLPTTGIATPNIINPMITTDTSAMYKLIARLEGCPDLMDSFYIDVQPNPDPFVGTTRRVCEFDSLRIHSSVDPPWYTHYTYSWSPSVALDHPTLPSVVFTADTTTNLVLTITTPAGCIGKDSVMIVVYPGNFATINNDTILCPHDTIHLQAAGGVSYQWTPSTYLDDATLANPLASPITSQTYTMLATSADGCHDTLSVGITVKAAAVIHLVDSVTIYPGETYQISPQTNGTWFSWSPAGGLNSKYVSNPVATPEVNTKYVVNTTTESGCKAVDSIYIYLDDNALIKVPNAFTPGAGSNDKLYIIKRGLVNLKHFNIYNRWGNLVFQTSDLDAGWDGTYKGVPQPVGVFVYAIEAVTNSGKTIVKSGNVTLLR